MPRTSDPSKQPEAFYLLMDRVAEAKDHEVYIQTDHPESVRGQLQSFLKCLEKADHPRGMEAAGLMVRLAKTDPRGRGIIICQRDRSPAAQAVLAALRTSSSGGDEAQSNLLKRLGA
jgi:hypothetical protein